jgi:hypothetical protein
LSHFREDLKTVIGEKLRESEINVAFYYYELHVMGSHDKFDRDEIVVKDPVSLKDKEK